MLSDAVLLSIPEKTGVYIFKASGKPIYIGKAKNLKRRLASHLKAQEGKSRLIVEEADDLEVIILANEKEALILEANLIFEHKPKYNAALKDMQVYPYIRISNTEPPYVEMVRSRKGDGEFYGPFTNVQFTRQLLEVLKKVYKFRTCQKDLNLSRNQKRACMEFHLGLCAGVCIGAENRDEYHERIVELRKALRGDFGRVLDFIRMKMEQHARLLDFENAAKYRDILHNFNRIMESQGVVLPRNYNLDVVVGKHNTYVVFRIRSGFLLSKLVYEFEGEMDEFLERFYTTVLDGRPERVVVERASGLRSVGKLIGLEVSEPLDELERSLLEKAVDNLNYEVGLILSNKSVLRQMKELLGLKRVPKRIEGLDISHVAGRYTTASLVVFQDGEVKKDEYRRYKLGDVLDDFESIRQVVRRRYSKHEVPDLLFVDGGLGQVNAAAHVLDELGKDVDVVGLAKEEEVIVTRAGSLKLPIDHPVLRLLVKLRDETHRVANTFTGELARKSKLRTLLDEVPGVGPKRRRLLLQRFHSIAELRSAPVEELEKLIGKRAAAELRKALDHIEPITAVPPKTSS